MKILPDISIPKAKIAKIKLVDGALEMHLEGSDEDTERKTVVKSLGSVHADLRGAMQSLEPHVRDILALPKDWCSNAFTVRAVSFSASEKTGVEGAVISCGVVLTKCDAPFFFNTPYLPIQRTTEEGVKLELSAEAISALEMLKAEAQAYLDGKRGQDDLFAHDAAATPTPAEEEADREMETAALDAAAPLGVSMKKGKAKKLHVVDA